MRQIPDLLDHVGSGWHPLLEELHAKLVAEVPEYKVAHLGEKFGGLRVYLDMPSFGQAVALISDAESRSFEICEFCGEPGRPQRPEGHPFGWVKTVCDSCQVGRS